MNSAKSLLTVILLAFCISEANAGKLITLTNDAPTFIAPSDYLIIYDSLNISIDEVQHLPNEAFNYVHHIDEKEKTNFWLKLEIDKQTAGKDKWLLAFFNHLAQSIVVYAKNSDGNFNAIDTVGIDLPFYERNIHTRVPVFEIPLNSGTNSIFIKYQSTHYFGLNTVLQKHIDYINFSNKYYFLIGGFYFILALLILYNALFYFSTRDKIYLYYILFVVAAALDCLNSDQLGFAIFWPNTPSISVFLSDYARVFFLFAMINYTTYFLQLKKESTRLYKSTWLVFILFLALELFSSVFFDIPYGLEITTLLIFTILALILSGAIIELKSGVRPVRIFIIGYLSICLGFILSYLFFNQFIDGNLFIYYIMFYGISVDTIMFSFALSSRLKKERLDKEKALRAENVANEEVILHMQKNDKLLNKVNLELEQKVQERTSNLEIANQKLTEQAQLIEALNQNLDKENWNLNKEIKKINTHRILSKNQNFEEVLKTFPDKIACYSLIAELKWSEGFICKKCQNEKAGKGTAYLSKRCTKCGITESVTSNTIFHKLKFPIEKAFYITYAVFNQKADLNLSEISRETDLNYQTCNRFKSKIDEAIESRKKKGIKVDNWENIIIDI